MVTPCRGVLTWYCVVFFGEFSFYERILHSACAHKPYVPALRTYVARGTLSYLPRICVENVPKNPEPCCQTLFRTLCTKYCTSLSTKRYGTL